MNFNCIENTKMKEKEAWNGLFKKILMHMSINPQLRGIRHVMFV